MKEYFSFDKINGDFEFHNTLEEAILKAKEDLEYFRGIAYDDGWEEDLEGSIGYGEVLGCTIEKIIASREDFTDEEWEEEEGYNSDFDVVSDYYLKEV